MAVKTVAPSSRYEQELLQIIQTLPIERIAQLTDCLFNESVSQIPSMQSVLGEDIEHWAYLKMIPCIGILLAILF
jgi:hypothetical protein